MTVYRHSEFGQNIVLEYLKGVRFSLSRRPWDVYGNPQYIVDFLLFIKFIGMTQLSKKSFEEGITRLAVPCPTFHVTGSNLRRQKLEESEEMMNTNEEGEHKRKREKENRMGNKKNGGESKAGRKRPLFSTRSILVVTHQSQSTGSV